jgi:hypothetical protein
VDHVFLRTAQAANQIPQDLPEDAERRRRDERQRCAEHDCDLEPVVITTYGDLADPAVWRARPLAHDGWKCPVGDHLVLGAILSPEQITALSDAGGRAAQAGDLDAAEYNFRRIVSAWPGFASGHSNLGAVYLDRVGAAQRAGEEFRPLLDVAIRELSRALDCDPPAGAQTRVMLGRIQARLGQIAEAYATLNPIFDDPDAPRAFIDMAHELVASLPPAPGPRFEHQDVVLTLPDGWRAVDPGGLSAMFEGPDHEMVNVALMPSPACSEAHLEHMMTFHQQGLQKNYPQVHPEPARRSDRPAYLCANRVYHVDGDGKPWTVTARYAICRSANLQAGMTYPAVQIVYYGSSWGPSAAVIEAIENAQLFGRVAAVVEAMQPPVASLEEAIERAELGASRAAIESHWPRDTQWTWDDAKQTLSGRPEPIAPFSLTYELPDDRLAAIRILIRAPGDWSTMELLEEHLRYQLPSFTFLSVRDPWSLDSARGRLEGKGNPRFMMGVPIAGTKDGTQVSGKAFAFNVEGRQHYGFELIWRPR